MNPSQQRVEYHSRDGNGQHQQPRRINYQQSAMAERAMTREEHGNPNLVASFLGFIVLLVVLYSVFGIVLRPTGDPAAQAHQLVTNAAANKTAFQINRSAALYRHAQDLGWGEPTTDELSFTVGGTAYVAQGFQKGILLTAVGRWSKADVQALNW